MAGRVRADGEKSVFSFEWLAASGAHWRPAARDAANDRCAKPPPPPAVARAVAGAVEPLENRLLLTTYYVSASAGDNDNAGTSLSAPFRTIQAAADRAQAGDTVQVRAGTYRETVTPAHSGAGGAPITFKNYNNEKVVVSGTERLTGWSNHKGSIYKAKMGWTLGDGRNQVFVDGQMMIEARWPNTTLDLSHPKQATLDNASGSTFYDAAASQSAGTWDGATIHFTPGQRWVSQTGKVTSSSPGKLNVSYSRMSGDEVPKGGDPYFLTGKFVALDSATEWFRDPDGTHYLWDPKGDDPDNHSVEVKRRDNAFDLRGLSNVRLDGIDLFAATVVTDSGSSNLRLTGMDVRYPSHFTVMPRGWGQNNASGIDLEGRNNVISGCTIAYSAGHGIALGGSGSRAENNVIHDVAYNGGDHAAIRTTGSGHVVVYNTIYNTGRSGIKISNTTHVRVMYNDIHDVMLQTQDGGGIYTFGINGQSEIAYNKVHHIHGGGHGATALMLDNGSSGYVIHHNLVYDVDYAMKMNTVSRNNKVYNNTLVATARSQSGSKQRDYSGSEFKNNIFTAPLDLNSTAKQSSNLYAGTDPRFVNPGAGNYQLQANSPAVDAGLSLGSYTSGAAGDGPDIGALERGRAPFAVGAGIADRPDPVPGPDPDPNPDPTPNPDPGNGDDDPGNGDGEGDGSGGTGGGSDLPTDDSVDPPAPTPQLPGDGSSTPTPVPETPTPPPAPVPGITVAEVKTSKLPARLIGGDKRAKARVTVTLRNDAPTPVTGPVWIGLYGSTDGSVTPDADLPLLQVTRTVRLKSGQSKKFNLPVRFPAPAADGDYLLLASISGVGVGTSSVNTTAAPLRLERPAARLAEVGAAPQPLNIGRNDPRTIELGLSNAGNVAAKGTFNAQFYVSADGTAASAIPVATLDGVKLNINAGDAKDVKLKFTLPVPAELLPAGNYLLLVKLSPVDATTTDPVTVALPFTVT
jgi:parallel beta-helix repeat protein